ncbi:MAG: exosortase family protein XrtF [Bacteroidia bacterium]|nr:exosortase family protein XrtF [Bacteroidia bacterium]MBT8270023.1 exosortase family protein XrtF [Bacteroidia bacterium]NNF81964.1 exosortase family protein XrtF [Flavobacteriaceae bacterium]NNK69600.1 exosortase family protein XrtF [Flavobacteriaceae bacterium]NNL79879.1 exosortase family protein XrtF [Flavobacteriaceae bacterium]
MKSLFKTYRSVVYFILTFLGVYLVLTLAYKTYLDWSDGSSYYPDYITNLTARQSEALIDTIGYDAQIIEHPNEPSMKLIINNKYVARVIEGCNSISIIILFISFIVAFRDTARKTIIYLLAGSTLIYSVNLIRIVILSVGLYHYPWRREILHTVIFPLIIYGMVFLLWMFWVRRFTISRLRDE